MSSSVFVSLMILGGGLLGGAVGLYLNRPARKQRAELQQALDSARFAQEQLSSSPLTMADSPAVPAGAPALPPGLVDACVRGECVLFTGSGIAAQAGLPTRVELLAHLLKELERSISAGEYTTLQALLNERPSLVAEMIAVRSTREQVFARVNELFAPAPRETPDAFKLAAEIPFAGVMTESWDNVLQRAAPQLPALYANDGEQLAQLVRDQRPWLLKLWGDLQSVTRFVFTPEQFTQTLFENPLLTRALSTIVNSQAILFIGASLESIENFLSALPLRHEVEEPSHFALVPTDYDLHVQQDRFRRKYGVELIPFTPTQGFPEVPAFLRELRDRVVPVTAGVEGAKAGPMMLERVQLQNIGPFTDLALDLAGDWTVLLGNNGCGKSTVLQAIALGLAGDDRVVADMGSRLLRRDAPLGGIDLRIGGSSYRTDLIRDGEAVHVICRGPTPLQAGTLVVLGFPPLRGVSTKNPRGPSQDGLANPNVGDVRALVTEAIDDRIDDLKQWVVNVELRAEGGPGIDRGLAKRYGRLRDAFFDVLNEMTPGLTLQYQGIDKSTWDLLVRTDDGVVPIDLVSQGTSSLLGWVGVVLQRLYEIYGDADDPKTEHALVLVDEIDAHMHPEWQQNVITLMREHFPNLQVVATTHSPLVVGNVQEGNTVRFTRDDEGRLVVGPMDVSFRGWYSDQILTSAAFGLDTTLDTQTQRDLDEYTRLLGKRRLVPDEEHRFQVLTQRIETTIPRAPRAPAAREARQLVEDFAAERFREKSDEERREIMAEVDSYLAEIEPAEKTR